jgi:hypothetical protein
MNSDNRNEKRYAGISLSVLFSPVSGKNLAELAQSYLHATSHDMSIGGMSFDVSEPVREGAALVVSVPNDNGSNDELRAIVRWCKKLSDGKYRIGVVFDVESGIRKSSPREDVDSILRGPGIPVEARLFCPACFAVTEFSYIGMQSYRGRDEELPLYNCKACGTTRSIVSLLSFNRDLPERNDD